MESLTRLEGASVIPNHEMQGARVPRRLTAIPSLGIRRLRSVGAATVLALASCGCSPKPVDAALEFGLGPGFSGATLKIALLELRPADGGGASVVASVGADGAFSRRIAAGRYEVLPRRVVALEPSETATPAPLLVAVPQVVDAGSGSVVRVTIDRRLTPQSLAVVVAKADGSALAAADIRIHARPRLGDSPELGAVTDSEGLAMFPGLSPGRYLVTLARVGSAPAPDRFDGESWAPVDAEVDVPADPAVGALVHLRSPDAFPVRLVVRRAGLEPSRRVHVAAFLRGADGVTRRLPRSPEQRMSVSDDGATEIWELGDVPRGEYLVTAWTNGCRRVHGTVVAQDGPAEPVVLVIGGTRPDIRIDLENGAAVERRSNVTLHALPFDPLADHAITVVDPEAGSISFPGVSDGRYLIQFWAPWVASLVDVDSAAPKAPRIALPARDFVPAGASTLTVRTLVRGSPVRRMRVGLARRGDGSAPRGAWMRCGDSPARFEGIAEGEYSVVVVDGVGGTFAGIPGGLRTRSVRVDGPDATLDIELE